MIKKLKQTFTLFLLSAFLFILFPFQAAAATIVYRTTVKLNSNFNIADWDWENLLGSKLLLQSKDLQSGSKLLLWNSKQILQLPEKQNESSLQQEEKPAQTPQDDSNRLSEINAEEKMMLDLVNKERRQAGLDSLVIDNDLVRLARMKSQDMIDKNYFSHTSPTYGSPFEMMKKYGVEYRYAGENLAGASSVEIAHRSLMNSSGHRANILNSNFQKIGIGIVSGGPYGKMFTQMFTG